MKTAIVSVINDLVTDQRVHKSCLSLQKLGYDVILIGRLQKNSIAMPDRPYSCRRMRLIFSKGPFFYAEYNIRLFLLLLNLKSDLYLANDLDTLLPNYLISRLKKKPIIFDSHEYFTETPELVNRPTVQKIWKKIEQFVLPHLDQMITVNDSIADLFRQEYGLKVHVIRNIPLSKHIKNTKTRTELNIPTDKFILVLQGSGINVHRGAEELVEAMQYLDEMHLLIIGGGDVLPILHKMVDTMQLGDKITFLSRMPYPAMMAYTQQADLGLTLDKDTNLNYKFSLPNKLFDYIQAGIPILATPLPEIKKIIDTYVIGSFVVNHEPKEIACAIKDIYNDKNLLSLWKKNTLIAAETLCWENEETALLKIYEQYN